MLERGRHGPGAEPRSFRAGRGELHLQLSATLAALGRNRAARNRQQAARARHDMRAWQVERRKRTRHLIELGGLVVKARVVDLTGDDRAIILGALLWMADRLKSHQSEQVRALWAAKGKEAFAVEQTTNVPPTISQETPQHCAIQLGSSPLVDVVEYPQQPTELASMVKVGGEPHQRVGKAERRDRGGNGRDVDPR